MRIAHYVERIRLEDGGVARAALDMCRALAEAGHEVRIITRDGSDVPREWNRPGTPTVKTVDPPGRTLGLIPGSRFRRQFAEALGGMDVLHLHGMWDLSNYAAAGAARSRGVPYVISPHGMLDDWPMSLHPWKKRLAWAMVAKRGLRGAARIHCAAAGELAESMRWFPRHLGVVAPLPFDLSAFRSLPGPGPAGEALPAMRSAGPRVLFLSRLVENKGADLVITAMPGVLKTHADAQLIIAGTGEAACEAALRAQAGELGVQGRVHFVGHVGGLCKVSLLESCDVFVLPTIHENFGFAILEAMAAGTPVITTRGAMLWRELSDGGAAIVDREAAAIEGAIRGMLDDPGGARARGERGREWVFGFLDAERIVRQLEAVYPTGGEAPAHRPEVLPA